jgi:hypothetical protein
MAKRGATRGGNRGTRRVQHVTPTTSYEQFLRHTRERQQLERMVLRALGERDEFFRLAQLQQRRIKFLEEEVRRFGKRNRK